MKKLGDDPTRWRWVTSTRSTCRTSRSVPGVAPIEWLFNYGPVGVSGGSSIVNATGWDPSVGYEVDAVPSMRMIVDPVRSGHFPVGAADRRVGHAFNAHYHDQFDLWRTGRTLPMRWDEASIKESTVDTPTLRP